MKALGLACLALAVLMAPAFARGAKPSRAAVKGCAWVHSINAASGLDAWVQRCDFGARKIDFVTTGASLAIRYDGGTADPLVDVLELKDAETIDAGLTRLFGERTDAAVAARCVLKPYAYYKGTPKGVRRYTFVPNRVLQAELDKTRSPDEVGDPPCGDFGDAPDGIQYFEVQPNSVAARRVLFVRIGQDEPLFDEQTLKILPAPPPAK